MPTRLPDRPSDSARSAARPTNEPAKNQPTVPFALLSRFPASNSRVLLSQTANIEFARIPQRVRIEHGRVELSDVGIGAGRNVRGPQQRKAQLFSDQLSPPNV